MIKPKLSWPTAGWLGIVALALAWLLHSDLTQATRVAELSSQGSPPPATDAKSPTGYVLGQRQFLGVHERGETYRWIANAQTLVITDAFPPTVYESDTVPTGRPQLAPRLYSGWLATVAAGVSFVTGESSARSVERTALYEPVIAHLLLFVAATVFMGLGFGAASAATTAVFVALFPPLGGQFIPGVLTPRTAALLLAAVALALHLAPAADPRTNRGFGVAAALAAGFALWLDPTLGFPAVLITAAVGGAVVFSPASAPSFLRWSLVGAATVAAGWLFDRSPWDPAAGELRYVHPLYAAAWLGLGLGLDGLRRLRGAEGRRKLVFLELAGAVALLAALIVVQARHPYPGWFYPAAALRRVTSLDETVAFASFLSWLAAAPGSALFSLTLLLAAAAAVAVVRPVRWPALVLLAGVGLMAFVRVRWTVVATLVALPALWAFVPPRASVRRWALAGWAGFLVLAGFAGWKSTRAGSPEAGPADLQAMVHRHFSHWLASHNPGQKLAVLAPPELADSIVFHGGGRVLMSTAWESFPGQVAASRILSAPEASEAEAVIQGRELTHLVLTSWDRALPFLVQAPQAADKDTLYDRLQRWVLPPYLRPMPYRLPAMAALADQKLVVFKVTAPQDEALLLSRLAEYFVEMERPEPAALAASVLAQSYADDPNAAIARALVDAQAKNTAAFEAGVSRIAAAVTAGRTLPAWDRRVQRAIVLALGHQATLARREIEACAEEARLEDLLELTPLQAYRLRVLMERFRVSFRTSSLETVLASLGAEYRAAAR